ncbi:hypothetical protein GF386_02630 [Candidatus Pacearchaeota archaeon]|nr:hypothetical protein [Candidatus Pacearchaeota archaeon]MBD3283044.1 hypothetical protein [Candidatus Pacearchaeota archaeon]
MIDSTTTSERDYQKLAGQAIESLRILRTGKNPRLKGHLYLLYNDQFARLNGGDEIPELRALESSVDEFIRTALNERTEDGSRCAGIVPLRPEDVYELTGGELRLREYLTGDPVKDKIFGVYWE